MKIIERSRRAMYLALTLLALLALPAYAQEQTTRRFEVSTAGGGAPAIVETIAGRELVSVAIRRGGQPTHHYSSYPQVLVSKMRIGRRSLYTIYHKEQLIDATGFKHRFAEVSGGVRKQHKAIIPLREMLADDMRILRAVREFDVNTDGLLAELSYAIVTYDDQILEGASPGSFGVTETTQTSASRVAGRMKLSRSIHAARIVEGTLAGCLADAQQGYNLCQSDAAVKDKTVCHNNWSSEKQTCYSVYGGPPTQDPEVRDNE